MNPLKNMNYQNSRLQSLIGIFALLFIVTCSNPKSESKLIILNVDLSTSSEILMSKLFKDITYIPLETNSKTMIGENFLRIRIFKDKIYTREQNKVLRFNTDGSFDKEIIHVGRGPDEIMGITDIALSDDFIFILGRSEVAKLNKDGRMIDKVKIPNTSESIYCYPDGRILIYHGLTISENSSYKVGLYDNNLKLIEYFFPNPPSNSRPVMLNCVHPAGKNVFITSTYNDTIFDMTNSRPEPYLVLDFGKQIRTYDNSIFISRYPAIMDIIPSDKFWFLHLYHFPEQGNRVEYRMIYYPKESRYLLTNDKIINDLDSGLDFAPFLIYSTDNQNLMFAILKPSDIIKRLNELDKAKLSQSSDNKFIEMAKKVDEFDNPVIMQCTVK
jgi:hypothetical protein